jgi:hypothetical protein
MPIKFTEKWPVPLRISASVVALAIDLGILTVAAIVMIFAMYFFNGLTAENLLLYGPSVMVEVAVIHIFSVRMLYYPKWAAFNKRHSKYLVFAIYYFYCWVVAYVSIHI